METSVNFHPESYWNGTKLIFDSILVAGIMHIDDSGPVISNQCNVKQVNLEGNLILQMFQICEIKLLQICKFYIDNNSMFFKI